MDRKLEVCRQRNIPLERVLIGSASATYFPVGYFLDELGEAFGVEHVSLPPRYSARSPADSITLKILHHDGNTELTGHRLTMRQVLALPVLRLSCMGHSLPSLARRSSSSAHLHRVDAARVGLERLSQHKCKLSGCSVDTRSPGLWRIVHWVGRGREEQGEQPQQDACSIIKNSTQSQLIPGGHISSAV